MQLKDSEILARLIYRAFIGPAEPGDSENMITFPMALALHARVAERENAAERLRNIQPMPLTLMSAPDRLAEVVKAAGDQTDRQTDRQTARPEPVTAEA